MFLLPKSYLQNTYRKNIDASLYDKCVDRDIVNLSQPDVVGTNISFIILLWEKNKTACWSCFYYHAIIWNGAEAFFDAGI